MLKTKKLDRAIGHASKLAETKVGLCVHDGFYYTGTSEELSRIGCLESLVPKTRMENKSK